MLNELCAGDSVKLKESEHAARAAIRARIEFWDGVQDALMGTEPSRAARRA